MIYLYASSSNEATILPSGSYGNGSGFIIKFTDGFSKDEYIAQGTGSKAGSWYNIAVEASTGSYVIGANKSQIPFVGGTYDVNVYTASTGAIDPSVYGSEIRKWKQMGNTWSSVPGIPTPTGNTIMTTRAFVSESIGRDAYSSTNENAAFVVYEG